MTLVIKSHLSDFNVRVTFSLLSDSGKIKSLRELLTRYKNQQICVSPLPCSRVPESWWNTAPSPLAICYTDVTLVECIVYHLDRSLSRSQSKVIPLCPNLVLPSSPIYSTLFTLCKYGINKQTSNKF